MKCSNCECPIPKDVKPCWKDRKILCFACFKQKRKNKPKFKGYYGQISRCKTKEWNYLNPTPFLLKSTFVAPFPLKFE